MPRQSTRTSRLIKASPEEVYRAFMDPRKLAQWLPPGDMTGVITDFDGRAGGGYRMSLYYPDDDHAHRGKTAEREDAVVVRFVEIEPSRRIVEAASFQSDNSAFHGEMTIRISFDAEDAGTRVTFEFENLPAGLRAEDNEEGARLSLEQLARLFGSPL